MAYNPELVKELLGEYVAELMDGTIEIIPADTSKFFGNLKVGDTLFFKFKDDGITAPHQFIVTAGK